VSRVVTSAEGIGFAREGAWGVVTLDRPAALNALTLPMCEAFAHHLALWCDDPEVGAVLVRAAPGRAFCAGGDVRALRETASSAGPDAAARFYREEYRLNWRIRGFPKPYVALVDGIVMGGGVGISAHGTQRVFTERALVAMPETGIGFFPDVGATEVLCRAPGAVGMHLGLTGERLGGADALYAGFATHYLPSARLPELEARLLAQSLAGDAHAAIEAVLATAEGDPGPAGLPVLQALIDRCFGRGSLAEIITALQHEGESFGSRLLAILAQKAPFSLHITFQQLCSGAILSFDESLQREFRLAYRFMSAHDFREGVRALLVDKDQQPRWQPATLDEVAIEEVAAWFAPLPVDELRLDWSSATVTEGLA
jgi:enoyl-CoA hydratase